MKKKLLLIVFALVCALTCAFGIAACDNPADKTVRGKAIGNGYITEIGLYDESGEFVGFLKEAGKNFNKNEKLIIRFAMPNRYGLGSMKMLVNGAETPFAYEKDIGPVSNYKGELNATKDFEITFSGTPERKAINIGVSYTPNDWKDRVESSDLLRVNVLINGSNANAGVFKNAAGEESVSLERFIQLIADNALTVKADDRVDIYVYSKSDSYKLSTKVLDANSDTKMTYENYTENHVQGFHYQFDVKRTDIKLTLSTHASDVIVQK